MPLSDQSKSYLSELIRLNKKDLIAIGYEKLTVAGTAVGLASIPTEARYALVVVESSVASGMAIRYLEYGAAPTASDGIGRANLDAFDIHGRQNMVNFKAIQTTGASTNTLHIQYYK